MDGDANNCKIISFREKRSGGFLGTAGNQKV